MVSVKILVCYHKKDVLFRDEILTPIHVGRAAALRRPENPDAAWLLDTMIGDDTGENISFNNASYNELTAVYWAWKNYAALGNPDYIGLAHYRRHFVLRRMNAPELVYRGEDPQEFLSRIGYSEEKLRRMLSGKDFAAHMSRTDSVYEQYIRSHRREDLDLAVRILKEQHPDYAGTADEYLKGQKGFFCNMFVMSKELFFDYCSFLFPILEEFERRTKLAGRRLFVSERLTGIYLAHQIRKKKRCRTLPVGVFAGRAEIPVAIPYRRESLFPVAVLLTSLLSHAHPLTRYRIFLLAKSPSVQGEEQERQYLEEVCRKWGNGCLKWICPDHKGKDPQETGWVPLLGELLPGVSKCLYLEENVTVLSDLEEFFRTCSVDDYEAAGVPAGAYDLFASRRSVLTGLLLVHTEHLRAGRRRTYSPVRGKKPAGRVLTGIPNGQIAYLPPWTTATESGRPWDGPETALRERQKGRAFVLWDREMPWSNPFVPGGSLWWEMASQVPADIPLPPEYVPKEGEGAAFAGNVQRGIGDAQNSRSYPASGRDAWRGYSWFGKLRFFYHHNGLGNTVRYGFGKLFRGILARLKGRS